MKTTDVKIRQLLEKVNQKKQEIKDAERPTWKTNCNFVWQGERFNVQTADEEQLVAAFGYLLVTASAHELAAEQLSVCIKYRHAGFSLEQWKHDFLVRLSQVKINDKKRELETMEKRLAAIVSPELRAQMELEDIEKSLGA